MAGGNSADGQAAKIPLDDYEKLAKFTKVQSSSAMSLNSLALTTHVHLLGFGMLFCLTGLVFSLTSYPQAVRCLIAPLALLAQVADIGCWWLGRLDPLYAQTIMVTGGIVAVSLVIQIVGSLFNMFGTTGKVVVFFLLLAVTGGGYVVTEKYVLPQLAAEQAPPAAGKK